MGLTNRAEVTNKKRPGTAGEAAAGRAHAKAVERGSRSRRPLLPFKIADTYLFSQMVGATLRGLTWFAGILIVAAFITAFRKANLGVLAFSAMAKIIALQLPRIFMFSLPMSLLYATVHTFGDLSSRGEITALNAGGMSLRRLMRAPLVWATVLAIIAFYVQEVLVPGAELGKDNALAEQVRAGLGVQQNFSFRDPPRGALKRIIQAERFNPKTNTLIQPRIVFFEGLNINIEVTAERGTWDEQTGQWKFIKGVIVTYPKGKNADGAFSIRSAFDEIERADLPDPNSMSQATKSRTEHLANGDFEMVSLADMFHYRQDMGAQLAAAKTAADRESSQKMINGATYGIHDKIATPLICLALVLVGVPLGLRPQRSTGAVSVGISFIVILVYYMVWTLASYPGKAGTVNPYLMAYLAMIVTTIVGATLMWKKSR